MSARNIWQMTVAVLGVAIVMDLVFLAFGSSASPLLHIPAFLWGATAASVLSFGLTIWSIGLLVQRMPDRYYLALSLFLFGQALKAAAETSNSYVLLIAVCAILIKIGLVCLLIRATLAWGVQRRVPHPEPVEHFR